jgi:hypothetical protein
LFAVSVGGDADAAEHVVEFGELAADARVTVAAPRVAFFRLRVAAGALVSHHSGASS